MNEDRVYCNQCVNYKTYCNGSIYYYENECKVKDKYCFDEEYANVCDSFMENILRDNGGV
ncbi:MAG: hypothetical protein ACFFD2_17230 [Promethearchaeota archaeon]